MATEKQKRQNCIQFLVRKQSQMQIYKLLITKGIDCKLPRLNDLRTIRLEIRRVRRIVQ